MKTSFKNKGKTLFQTVSNLTCTPKVFTVHRRKMIPEKTVIDTMELRPEMENM